MTITSSLFAAFLKCPTKCWLRANDEKPSGNAYAEWVQSQKESFRATQTERLLAEMPPGESARSPSPENLKASQWRLAVDVVARAPACAAADRSSPASSGSVSLPGRTPGQSPGQPADGLSATVPQSAICNPQSAIESRLHAIERVPSEGRGKPAKFIPIRFIFRNKLTKDDRLLLAFDAFVLAAALGRDLVLGKIIHGDDHAILKVKTSALTGEMRKRLERIAALLASPTSPDVILNRHCGECEFKDRCRQLAIEKDDLSLLAGMSDKERQKLRSKGIFTVTQLSYTFRPRRRPKRQRAKREKYHHALKALAIREKKIHIVGSPELKIEGTPVYLDVEGLPDRDFYYLIGLRIGNGESAVQHSLRADTIADEGKIWREFLALLETVERPVLVHYGSYETTFLKRMGEKYRELRELSVAARAIQAAVNLLSVIFAQVYFPTFTNGLKEIAGNLGFRWSDPTVTGIRSVACRQQWEESTLPAAKQALLTYNAEDCAALGQVAHRVLDLHGGSPKAGNPAQSEVVDTAQLKREHPYGFKRNTFVFPEFDTINKAAYWDYQRDRVYVKSAAHSKVRSSPALKHRLVLSLNKMIACPRPGVCPQCGAMLIYKHQTLTKIVFDLKFTRHARAICF